jgi:endonuclease/exonuclease/phosphatase family metal-dependent hydrolase
MINVVTAYQVCDKPVTTATKKKSRTAAAQQACMMRQRGIPNTHPQKQFCKDNEELLLAGDFNKALRTNASGMTRLCADLGLVDRMQSHRDGTNTTPTNVRGNTRIDYGLATPHVATACTVCGYEPFQHQFPGDHRGMFVKCNY